MAEEGCPAGSLQLLENTRLRYRVTVSQCLRFAPRHKPKTIFQTQSLPH